jgi:hypothetical protein
MLHPEIHHLFQNAFPPLLIKKWAGLSQLNNNYKIHTYKNLNTLRFLDLFLPLIFFLLHTVHELGL